MKEYRVSYMVIYSEVVEAESAEEAAEIVARNCPYDVDGGAFVVDKETGEEYDLEEYDFI